MNPILSLARPEILNLKPYSHAAWLPGLTRLHANEAPWRPTGDHSTMGLNRYPEPQPAALIERLAYLYSVPQNSILATRGSDEAIDLLSRIFLRAGQDAILQCSPTFGMYQVAARIQGAEIIEVPLDRAQNWSVDPDRLLKAWHPNVKLVYLCSPNNPTGNLLGETAVEAICTALAGKAIVVLDEAYVEWSGKRSLVPWLDRFPSLVILRTLSKAHALAGARIGALLADPELIQLARRVIPPYSLASLAIEAALGALTSQALDESAIRIKALLVERDYLRQGLEKIAVIGKIWPSDANFMLVDSDYADSCMRATMAASTLVRDLRAHPSLPRSLRITVGSRAQNDVLLQSLRQVEIL